MPCFQVVERRPEESDDAVHFRLPKIPVPKRENKAYYRVDKGYSISTLDFVCDGIVGKFLELNQQVSHPF